jgi:hypothetical protein
MRGMPLDTAQAAVSRTHAAQPKVRHPCHGQATCTLVLHLALVFTSTDKADTVLCHRSTVYQETDRGLELTKLNNLVITAPVSAPPAAANAQQQC